MSEELERFERELKKIENLQFGFLYVDKHCKELGRQLSQVSVDKTSSYYGMTFDDFRLDQLEAFLLAEIVLLRRSVEYYSSAVHKGNDWRAQTDMKKRCPSFMIRYDLDCPEVHVIDLSYELRNLIVHPLDKNAYRCIEKKDLSPLDILKQHATMFADGEGNRKTLVLQGKDHKSKYLSRLTKAPIDYKHTRSDLFSGILFEEVRDCIRTYDRVRKMSTRHAIEKSNALHPALAYG